MPPAVAAAPAYTISRYLETVGTTHHYNLGCNAAYNKKSGVIVLIYGKPVKIGTSWGASLYGGADATTTQIASAVKQYARGYYECSFEFPPTDTWINLVVATTNCCGIDQVHYTHGAAWANMVNGIGSWISSQGYAGKVRIRGGSDMEPGFNIPSRTRDWWQGYDSANSYFLYNAGSADGCPTTGNGTVNGTCNNSWRQSDAWEFSWEGPAVPLPQIYTTTSSQAKQWQKIKLYGVVSLGRTMTILGSLTQYWACQQRGPCSGTDNTPSEGWQQLYDQLNSDSRTAQSLSYSTDIRWE